MSNQLYLRRMEYNGQPVVICVQGVQCVPHKIGFTKNPEQRTRQYDTANPCCVVVEYVETYSKTRHALERQAHKELKRKGYTYIDKGSGREWFAVPVGETFSLATLTVCKGRKIYRL